jgi:hypothetical protein
MAKQKAISGALLQYPKRDVGIEVIHRQKSTAYTQQQTTDDQDPATAKDRGTTQTKISTRQPTPDNQEQTTTTNRDTRQSKLHPKNDSLCNRVIKTEENEASHVGNKNYFSIIGQIWSWISKVYLGSICIAVLIG